MDVAIYRPDLPTRGVAPLPQDRPGCPKWIPADARRKVDTTWKRAHDSGLLAMPAPGADEIRHRFCTSHQLRVNMMPVHTLRRLMALGAMALLIGAGLCVFDLHDDDGSGLDLCLSALALVTGPLALLVVAAGARFAPARVARHSLTFFDPVAPPPRI